MKFGRSSFTIDTLPPQLKKAVPYFILVLAVFIAYGDVYNNGFLYDDESLIVKNIFLRSWGGLGSIFTNSITAGANIAGGFYRPLQILLYFFIYQVAGLSLFAFHVLNVSLHAANACLLYRFGQKLRFNPTAVFSATLIWALHPVHTETIAYMSGTADPLYVLFTLLGLIRIAPQFKRHQIIASLPFFVLAMLSKEDAILFPLLAMSCVFLFDKERFDFKSYFRFLLPISIATLRLLNRIFPLKLNLFWLRRKYDRNWYKKSAYLHLWPLWLTALVYLIVHAYFLNFGGFHLHKEHDLYAASILCRTTTFLATLPYYLGFVVWPVHLHFDRDFQFVADPLNLSVMAGIAMVGIAATQILLGRTRRALAFSWALLWFGAADILHTGILIPVNASLLEHWLYLPSAGLFLGVAQSLASVKWQRKERKPVETTILTVVALVLCVMTYEQNKVWRDAETLYLNIFKNGEPSPHAHNNLGILYALSGRQSEALEQFELSIEFSGDRNPEAEHDLAITLLNGPDGKHYTQEAIMHLQKALEINPDYYPASEALAVLYDQEGYKDKAEFYRQKAATSHAKVIGP